MYFFLDFETRSKCDIGLGARQYVEHPSTEVLCMAWAFHGGQKGAYEIGVETEIEKMWQILWNHRKCIFVAHNAGFERQILMREFNVYAQTWACTMAMASSCALPRGLDKLCEVLKIRGKDSEGSKLMLKLSKPDKMGSFPPISTEEWQKLKSYCAQDVECTIDVFFKLPGLNLTEQHVWELDFKINNYGLNVDRDLSLKCEALSEEIKVRGAKKIAAITEGKVETVKQVLAFKNWVSGYVPIENLAAKTVTDLLVTDLPPIVREALLVRQECGLSSTAKFHAINRASEWDHVCRGSLIYHGAATGRWTGSGIQPQNLPRGKVEVTDQAIEDVKTGDLNWLELFYKPADLLSSLVRSCFVPRRGNDFYCADFSSIESRVLFWLSRHKAGVEAYENDRPIYEEMAAYIFGVPVPLVTKAQRQVGKQAVLGCGYGMGPKKFMQTCQNFGLEIDLDLANKAVKAYREAHSPVPKFWKQLEQAVIMAMMGPHCRVGAINWEKEGDFLFAELPSGRRLAYPSPEIVSANTPWGEAVPALEYGSLNPVTRKWERNTTYGGSLAENVTQAVARDLMAEAMLRVDEAGYDIVLTVHDEVLAEKKQGDLKEFLGLMTVRPLWAMELPIKADGWVGDRYKK